VKKLNLRCFPPQTNPDFLPLKPSWLRGASLPLRSHRTLVLFVPILLALTRFHRFSSPTSRWINSPFRSSPSDKAMPEESGSYWPTLLLLVFCSLLWLKLSQAPRARDLRRWFHHKVGERSYGLRGGLPLLLSNIRTCLSCGRASSLLALSVFGAGSSLSNEEALLFRVFGIFLSPRFCLSLFLSVSLSLRRRRRVSAVSPPCLRVLFFCCCV